MTGAIRGAGIAYTSGAHELTTGVERDSCCSNFSFHGKMQFREWWWIGSPPRWWIVRLQPGKPDC